MKNKENLIEVLNIAKKNGMKVFYTKRENSCYGWIITKNDNVLYIQPSYFGGYDFSLEYKPSKKMVVAVDAIKNLFLT